MLTQPPVPFTGHWFRLPGLPGREGTFSIAINTAGRRLSNICPVNKEDKGETMIKFKIDRNKHASKKVHNTILAVDPTLYRWIKIVAAVNEVTISSVLNQAIEYTKKNSERISL